MHEYGIVQDLLSKVEEQVRGHEGKRAVRVVLAIDGGHVDQGFLRDAFDTFKASTTAREAELVLMQRPVQEWCPECGARETVTHPDATCPHCGGSSVQVTETGEIYLQSVEIEV